MSKILRKICQKKELYLLKKKIGGKKSKIGSVVIPQGIVTDDNLNPQGVAVTSMATSNVPA